MGIVDALCILCGRAFSWIPGNPRYCRACQDQQDHKPVKPVKTATQPDN